AESDIAVAAASILARERFINWLRDTGREMEVTLPKGVSDVVKSTGRDLVARHGPDVLKRVAKVHFKTAHDVAPEHYKYVEKPKFVLRRPPDKSIRDENEG